MRMKKLMILAVAALATIACSRTFDVKPEAQQEIGFKTWNETLTKSRTQGESGSFASDDHFWVYGYKGTNTPVFQSQEVTTENGTDWTYTPKKFWDSSVDSYTFFALSRVESGDPTKDPASSVTTGSFASNDITFAGSDQDILVAKKKVVNKGSDNFNSWHTVDLDFHHIASIVDFKVKKTANLENSTVKITGISLLNVKNNGKYSISYSGTDPVATWEDCTSSTTTTYTNASGVGGEVALATDVAKHTNSSDLINNLIVRPHTLADTELLQISYTITTPVGSSNEVITVNNSQIKLNKFDITDYDSSGAQTDPVQNGDTKIVAWEPGKHYIYYLTIDVHTIEFTASITDWDTVNAYRYLVN